jgi:hypothetical protein
MCDTCEIYSSSRARPDERKILHSQYTLPSHAEGTGFRTCEQEGSPANPNQTAKLILDSDSDKSQCDVWLLWRMRKVLRGSFIRTTSTIAEQAYSAFQHPASTQFAFSQYL